MTSLFETTARPRPSFAELFTPKIMTVLREGYGPKQFHADAIAGLTVAIVALPLSMAIAIASGVSPERGLYTAIIGGFLVSALGGSRFQIGGPASAFIVLGAGIVERHCYDGLALATLMAGLVMIAVGLMRLATPLFGHGWLHRRYCRHHLCQPAQGVAWARSAELAHRVPAQARGLVAGARRHQPRGLPSALPRF